MMALGVYKLDQMKIIHSDLKPANFLLFNNGNLIKATDFGISKKLQDGKSYTYELYGGTNNYSAPEYYREDIKF